MDNLSHVKHWFSLFHNTLQYLTTFYNALPPFTIFYNIFRKQRKQITSLPFLTPSVVETKQRLPLHLQPLKSFLAMLFLAVFVEQGLSISLFSIRVKRRLGFGNLSLADNKSAFVESTPLKKLQ